MKKLGGGQSDSELSKDGGQSKKLGVIVPFPSLCQLLQLLQSTCVFIIESSHSSVTSTETQIITSALTARACDYPLAPSVERWTPLPEVPGSIPGTGTRNKLGIQNLARTD